MKKIAPFLLIIFVALCAFTLAGCDDPLKNAQAKADDYVIVASYNQNNHSLACTQVVTVTNNSNNSFVAIKFHIYANQYRQDAKNGVVPPLYKVQAYPNGESWGEISFDSVKVKDTPVAYVIEGEDMDILSVPLDKELYPDQKVTVELNYTVTLANVKHRLGYTDNAVNLGNFYPILCHVDNDNYRTTPYYNVGDPFVSEVANYDVTITVPNDYVVASSGQLVTANADGDATTYNYVLPAGRDFALVLSQKYKKLSQTVGQTEVNYYYFDDANAEQSLKTAVGMMEYLNKNVGTYPYAQYSMCQTDFCYGGMEYPGLTYVTCGLQNYDEAIAHETAHQWFYGVVGNDQIEHAWMDEGLAEFVTFAYMDSVDTKSLDKSILANVKTYTTYVDVLNHYYKNVDTGFRPIYGYKNDSEYVIFTYVKGSLLFNTLYETLGESKFFKALAKYYQTCAYQLATPDQLANCFAQVGGKELVKIFDDFACGKEIIGKVTD